MHEISDKLWAESNKKIALPTVTFVVLVLAFIPVQLFNRPIFTVLNSLHSPLSDLVWISFTTLGDGLLLVIILGCFVLVNPQVTFVGLTIMLLSSLAVHGIKAFYVMPRPAEVMGSLHMVGPILRWGAFPSGHAAASMSAGLAISYFSSSITVSLVVLSLTALISISRVFVGAHFPMDILGGIVIALGLFIVFFLVIWPKLRNSIPEKPNVSSIVFRIVFYSELLAALFALCIYAPFVADYAPVAVLVAMGVLMFLALRFRTTRLIET